MTERSQREGSGKEQSTADMHGVFDWYATAQWQSGRGLPHSKSFAESAPAFWSAAVLFRFLAGSANARRKTLKTSCNPNGVAAHLLVPSDDFGRNPFGVVFPTASPPRVARRLATLSFGPESLWDSSGLQIPKTNSGLPFSLSD